MFQENFPAVMRKNTKHLSEQPRGRFLRVLMWSAVHVLVLEILGLQTLGSVRLIYICYLQCIIAIFLFNSLHLRYLFKVLIDESTQATEPECLIPLVLGAKQVFVKSAHAVVYSLIVDVLTWCFCLGCSCWWSLSAWSSYYVQESSSCWISTIAFWAPCSTRCQTN